MTDGGRQLRGAGLLAHVYGELRAELGEIYSTEELLQAAEVLVRLSSQEYVEKNPFEVNEISNYYNHDVYAAFRNRGPEILLREAYDDSIEDDRLSRNFSAEFFVNKIINGYEHG